MRTPADLPRRQRATPRSRIGLVVGAVLLFGFILSLRGIAGFYTDYLWFDSLGLSSVWSGVLGAKFALGGLFTALFFVLMWSNLFIADRLAPRFRPVGPEEEVVERYHELVGEHTGLVRTGVAALFALIAGLGVSTRWEDWLLFTNAVDFNEADPQFGMDIGFYVFKLPFLTFLVDWALSSFVIILIVTVAAHYVNGGIRVQTPGQRVTPQVKAHISVLLGVLALIKAMGYYLQRFELTFSTRGVVDGASYTDVKAQLPAIQLLILISVFAFVLLLWNIRQRGWVLPVIAVGLWAFVAVVAGTLYPTFIQRFTVEPSESSKEAPYIARNIEATRAALNLDDVEENPFDYSADLEAEDLQNNEGTIRNVRLLDPAVVADTYQREQAVKTFYRFPDLDVDRYVIDGEVTQVVLAARELARDRVPQDSWEARQLAYTHGYGLAMAPANAVQENGSPRFVVGDLPPKTIDDLELDQPAIYFGESIGGYSIVNTGREEVDYEDEDGTVTTSYEGDGGVDMGSWLRRAAFGLRFGDVNPLISNLIEDDSKILYIRDVRERVQTVAPFLHFDADPYPVLLDGRIVYLLDGYTTSDNYPYAQGAVTDGLPRGTGLDHDFNYVRNSVKAVVDAYNGDVDLYVMEEDGEAEPIVRAYRKAFPELFSDFDEMPDELRDHLRYPEDLFQVQTTAWSRYHLDDVSDFYDRVGAWSVAQDPGNEVGTQNTTQTTNAQGQIGPSRDERIDPYYLLMRLPGEDKESFVMLRPFVPFSEDDRISELTSFMVAKSDPDEYGKLQTYVMPQDDLPDGPELVNARINSNEAIAREVNLLNREDSQVVYGNLLLIPIENSLLYVRPLYVQARNEAAVPELRNVIVFYDGEAVMEPTLREALEAVFGQAPDTQEEEPEEPAPGDPGEPEAPTETQDEETARLLSEAAVAFDEAEAALEAGDLGTYQDKVGEAQDLIDQAIALGDPPSTTTTTSGATA